MADAGEQNKSKRPANSKFKQQQLPAWKPVLTPTSVIPTFLLVGVVFTIIGAVLLAQSNDLQEYEYDYTNCDRTGHRRENDYPGQKCGDLLESDPAFTNTSQLWNRCECVISVPLSGFDGKDVYIYYGMENYYQNHRRYVKSRSDAQLRSAQKMGDDECDPLEKTTIDGQSKYYAPCGLIANSLFNDTIELMKSFDNRAVADGSDLTNNDFATSDGEIVPGYTGCGISWDSDREVKFKNPDTSDLCSDAGLNSTDSTKPPNWANNVCLLGADDRSSIKCASNSTADSECSYNPFGQQFYSCGQGYQNEDFIVWMRTAALPTFRKLYRRIPGGFPDGNYELRIGYNYPVKSFDGVKKVYISTTSSVGGKSWFLPAMYMAVGILSLVSGAVFLVLQHFCGLGRKLGDVSYLAWHHHGDPHVDS